MILKRWLEDTILELNLCPFARAPYEAGRVRLDETLATDPLTAQQCFLSELERLFEHPELSTTLIGFPQWAIDFEDFLGFTTAMEDLLLEAGLREAFQLVAFHPDFRLADHPAESFAHWAGSAPLPVLHLLRRAEVLAASQGEQGEKISRRNESVIAQLTAEQRVRHFFWKY